MNINLIYATMAGRINNLNGIGDFNVTAHNTGPRPIIMINEKKVINHKLAPQMAIFRTEDALEFRAIVACFLLPGSPTDNKVKINAIWKDLTKLTKSESDLIIVEKHSVAYSSLTKWIFTIKCSLQLSNQGQLSAKRIAGEIAKMMVDVYNRGKSEEFTKLLNYSVESSFKPSKTSSRRGKSKWR